VVGLVLFFQPVVLPMALVENENVPFKVSVSPKELTIPVGGSETVTLTVKWTGAQAISISPSVYIWESSSTPRSASYGIYSELYDKSIIMSVSGTENIPIKIYVKSTHNATEFPSGKISFTVSDSPRGTENAFSRTVEVKVNVVPPPLIPMEITLTTFQVIGLCLVLPSAGALLRRRR